MSQNVYWDPELGATCPHCGSSKVPVTSSPPWNDGVKVRFHRCSCGSKFKSIQMTSQAMQEKIEKMEKIAERARSLGDWCA